MADPVRNDIEEALQHWSLNAKRAQKMNYASAEYYSRRHLLLGIVATILTTIVGTSVFLTLETNVAIGWKIATGLLSITAAVLASLQTFLQYGEKAGAHTATAAEYGAVKRQLEQSLIMARAGNVNIDAILTPIREKMDRLAQQGPQPPECVYKKSMAVMPGRSLQEYDNTNTE